ncbi:hypothetical protein C8N28_1007 [Albibacterium bauzanense]|uniref:Sugar lactone lactonase YvrE n=2 Tax=Albibacterium bauzanense TaxID=653929 RepID=A0A4R1M1Y4_9SPHI|nr:hypothetical protein C8N28_1007 [Albibacterium bauzanense]
MKIALLNLSLIKSNFLSIMKNLSKLKFIAPFLFLYACGGTANNTDSTQNVNDSIQVSLSQVWSTDTTQLATPECVTYDPATKVLYVSNLNRANDIDNDGYISIVNTDGSVKNAQWVKGLGAPLGNDIYDGHLYVNDNTNIVKINIETGEIVDKIQVDGATRLNGISVGPNGDIYSADIEGNKIFKVTQNGEVSIAFESAELDRPNGVLIKGNDLIIASFNAKKLLSVNLESKEIKVLGEGLESADGIVALDNDNYLVSSWTGLVHFVGNDSKVQKILDTKGQSINAADITFIPEENLLVVPTFNANSLMAYKMELK